MGIEKFHSRTVNGILQEFHAAMIMSVITRCLMMLTSHAILPPHKEAQFKNALITSASEAAILVPNDPEQAALILREILKEIAGAKYYRPAKPRASQPGVNKSPSNKRQTSKKEKMLRKRLSQQHCQKHSGREWRTCGYPVTERQFSTHSVHWSGIALRHHTAPRRAPQPESNQEQALIADIIRRWCLHRTGDRFHEYIIHADLVGPSSGRWRRSCRNRIATNPTRKRKPSWLPRGRIFLNPPVCRLAAAPSQNHPSVVRQYCSASRCHQRPNSKHH